MGEATRQVGSAVFWSVLARGGRFVLGLVSSVIVVRSLGDHGYGVLSLVRTILTFVVVVAGVGLGQSLLKFLPVYRVGEDAPGARALVRRVFVVQTGVWIVLSVLTWLLRGRVESLFGIEGLGLILMTGVGLAVFELYFTLISHVLNAYYDTKRLSAAHILSHLLFIACLLVVLPRGWGVLGVVVAAASGNVAASLFLLRTCGARLAGAAVEKAAVGIERARFLRFSLPFALIGLLNVIVWRQSETIFLAHFRGAEETGYFDLAYRLPQIMLEFIPGTVWPIIMAGFSEVYARNKDSLRQAISTYYKMLFLMAAPICVVGVTLGGRMIPILFGESMAPAALPAQLFFGIFTVSFFGTPLSMALYVMEKSHINLIIYIVLAIVNVGLDLLLIPRFGIIGALVPVAMVIILSPFIYKRVLDHFVGGVRIPFVFIARCFLASGPVLLLWPFIGFIRGVPELIAATIVAGVLVVFSAKKLRLIGEKESELLASIPIPVAEKFLKFMST